MICLICRQSTVIGGFTSVKFERGEIDLLVKNVPARVCPSCGEAYVDEDVASWLLQNVEEVYRAGRLEEIFDYKGFRRNNYYP
jgi:YgiT-type zinc finger domain-containing protein